MKQFFKSLTGKITGLLVMVVLLAAAVAAHNRYNYAAKSELPARAEGSSKPNPSFLSQRKVITGESITLTRVGFEPAEITRGPGRFVLNINNRSGVHEATFRLTHETGNRLREVQFPKGRLSSRELLNLSPGRYRLSEVNHPNWVCKIEITAH